MDPAFLVWIPPIEEGDIIKEIDESNLPVYEVNGKLGELIAPQPMF